MDVARTLVVEDDDLLARAIARELSRWCSCVEVAKDCREAAAALRRRPGLVLTDVRLPDGNGIEIVRQAARISPKPRIIALSAQANAAEGFDLAKAGACAYLPKPLSLDSLLQTIEAVLTQPVDVTPLVADNVGTVKFETLQDHVKSTMIHQALGLTDFNVTHAATMLGVSRQRLQQWIRALEITLPDRTSGSSRPD